LILTIRATRATAPAARSKVHDRLINLGLLAAASLLALLLAEAAVRVMGWEPLYVSPERSRFWRHDAMLGWAHRPGQSGMFATPQFRTHVRISPQGLRDREHSYERAPGTRRILVLGDSFAWGYGVEEPDRFTQRLESALGVEVINAGISGYSTDQELLWFQNEGSKYEVDLVLLSFTGNDLGHNARQLVYTIYYKPAFALKDGRLALQGYPVPTATPRDRLIYSLSQQSALAYLLINTYFDVRSSAREVGQGPAGPAPTSASGTERADPYALTLALAAELRRAAEARGAEFAILATDRWWNGPAGATYAGLLSELRTQQFEVLDVEAMPGFEPETMVIADDGHWNADGHQYVAERLEDLIRDRQLLGRLEPQAGQGAARRPVTWPGQGEST
jgi:lysophospholipase L1-like esterase